MGRLAEGADADIPMGRDEDGDVDPSISREHAVMRYWTEAGLFNITAKGPNGMYVDDSYLPCGSSATLKNNKTVLRAGSFGCMFRRTNNGFPQLSNYDQVLLAVHSRQFKKCKRARRHRRRRDNKTEGAMISANDNEIDDEEDADDAVSFSKMVDYASEEEQMMKSSL
mmetsp:Transcript_18772/g.33577  ORF Transcript_18772/g.33577 Transcript_18772/m.33577 type:complete len:168 (+) Transcript_18772:315-818(+)|eukprot:CAMPEP_0197522080 /NCGR_PEP_ID=MMETSP1318-20131121/7247_1 /TAXON_ID=552666 /ORGANISM="Partenskyella glossopodia, Strain RCC365" /LENGTH=167 /DNA_ID=CAMNT_0043074311 /DNA_START=287 /DNA_END=790 /DNA_ORIENTATION=-